MAELLPRLQVTSYRRTSVHTARGRGGPWAEEVPRSYAEAGRPFERSLLDAALDVYRTVDRGCPFLVNQDLHGGNVLRASREPWLVIDPKPLVGERELEASGLLRNADSASRWLDVLARREGSTATARAAGPSPTTSLGHGTSDAAGSSSTWTTRAGSSGA